MSWDDALTNLNQVLADLYTDSAQARRVAQMAGIPLFQVSFSSRPIDNWYAILMEAEHQGRVLAVAEVALKEYPARMDLVAATEVVRRRSPSPSPSPREFTHQDKLRLRDLMIKHFTLNDLRMICQNMEIDYESIEGGDNKAAKARELVAYCDRRMKLQRLADACRALFPDVSW
jgi:hypothetical protein